MSDNPLCGATIATAFIEGNISEQHYCQRREGPCPWRGRDGQVVGLQTSQWLYGDDFSRERVDLPPCAETNERAADQNEVTP